MNLEKELSRVLDEKLAPILMMTKETLIASNDSIRTLAEIDGHLDKIEENICNVEKSFNV